MTESEELIMRSENNGEFQENKRAKEISTLLNTLRHCAKNELEKVQNLIGNEIIKSDLTARKIRRRLTGERYSIFDAIGRSDSETSHSLFLRHLLDPMETHDQGTVFLDCFVNTVKLLAKEQGINFGENLPYDWRGAKALTEVAHDDGRIDIVIELANEACIVIENKVWASEQDRQIARYGKWLESKTCHHKVLVFLTSTGYCSQTKEGFDVINISYGQLAHLLTLALSRVEPTAIPVLSVVKQYIDVCNYIFTGSKIMTHSNKEIIELLKNPSNFEIALDIGAYVKEIDLDIRKKFISNVVKLLNDRLISENISREWVATGFDHWGVANSISLETNLSEYRVFYGNLFHKIPKERQFGWYRKDNKIDTSDEEVEKLFSDMSNNYLSQSSNTWLCCITGVNQKIQIPSMDMSWDDTDTKLAIMKDNLKDPSQDRTTIAYRLADSMWDIFSKYRDKVENLVSFKS
jgi:hypothetical protein